MFEYLDYSLVIKTLEVPTVSGEEQMMRDYIIKFAQEHSIDYTTDKSGNVYLTKGQVGEEEFYPCVTAHISWHLTHLNKICLGLVAVRDYLIESFMNNILQI